ncbi:MAG: hypothetical protein AAB956_01495, partial [Patescibacteria group bacterium]
IANDEIVPRSLRSDNGLAKPVSFLGIILVYGVIAKVLGVWIVPFLTPLLAIVGILFFYRIVREIATAEPAESDSAGPVASESPSGDYDAARKKALLSAGLLLALAPYWYYAARGLFHNVLFIDLILAGAWLSLRGSASWRKRSNPDFIQNNNGIASSRRAGLAMTLGSGMLFGLAVITRASELIWLAPAMVIIWLFYFKQINWRKLILFLAGIFLALMPMFYYNQTLYGGALNFGYNKRESSSFSPPSLEEGMGVVGIDGNPPQTSIIKQKSLDRIKHFVTPFGFHPRAVWHNFINYYVKIFWYLFWPALLGGLLYLWKWKEKNKAQQFYFYIFILTSVILAVYYGSWAIQDSIALNPVTIGNSYTRY